LIPQLIDTISISLSSEAVKLPSLEAVRMTFSDFGESVKGNYRNLLISQFNGSVTISGSLQKFNRSESLTLENCRDSINHLSDTFSFDPSEARLKRVDFAKTIQTDFEPKIYYPFLGNHQRYFRSPHKDSLYYSNSLRVLNFYDKAKEQRISGNLLRYEQRYFKPETIFKKSLYLVDLLTEEVYSHFLINWRSDYNRIQKVKTLIPMEAYKKPSDFFTYLIALGASEVGNDLLFNQIKIAQRSGHLSKQNAKRIRDKMRNISKGKIYEPNQLIDELDEKINRL
jgi:hypothetical protein